MTRVIAWFARQRNRAYLYRVVVSGGAVAAAYGVVTADKVALWAGLVATGFALPAANTTTKEN